MVANGNQLNFGFQSLLALFAAAAAICGTLIKLGMYVQENTDALHVVTMQVTQIVETQRAQADRLTDLERRLDGLPARH